MVVNEACLSRYFCIYTATVCGFGELLLQINSMSDEAELQQPPHIFAA